MADGSSTSPDADVTFAELYRSHHGFVRAALRRHVHPADLDDVTQEVFVLLLRKLQARLSPVSVRAWLYQALRRVAANHRRGVRRFERKRSLRWRDLPTDSPESGVVRREAAEILDGFLADLDHDAVRMFVWSEIDGLPGRVIAERLDLNLHTAYARLRRLRRRFQDAVRERQRPARLWFVFPWPTKITMAAAAVAATVLLHPPGRAAPPPNRTVRLAEADLPQARLTVVPWFPAPAAEPSPPPTEELALSPLRIHGAAARQLPEVEVSPPVAQHGESPPFAFGLRVRPRPRRRVTRSVDDPLWLQAVDADGSVMPGAHVRCRRIARYGIRRRCPGVRDVVADGEGRFELGSLSPGRYELQPFGAGQNVTAAPTIPIVVDASGLPKMP